MENEFGGIFTSDSGVVSGAAGSTPGGLVGEEPGSDVAMLKRWRESRQASPLVLFYGGEPRSREIQVLY